MVILDLFYDLLNIDTPAICDNYEAALKSSCKFFVLIIIWIYYFSVDPTWNLTTPDEDYTYVASEGAAKLPRLSSTR